ncbi:hypothetical protein COL940_011430 [Colletotrichum noveboracense]|nr:hypothetical protein COL940_011430 [Colletotrichum noveboracense]
MASSMLAITAPNYTNPSGYQLSTIPQPVISDPTDVLFRVHAASINPVDVKKAAGIFKLAVKERFVELSGTGAYACQLAKKVFNAGKVITTVSTSKVDQVPKLLGDGTVDQASI